MDPSTHPREYICDRMCFEAKAFLEDSTVQ